MVLTFGGSFPLPKHLLASLQASDVRSSRISDVAQLLSQLSPNSVCDLMVHGHIQVSLQTVKGFHTLNPDLCRTTTCS